MKVFLALLSTAFFISTHSRAQGLLPPITVGQRVATCGHSFHVFTYKQVNEIAGYAGIAHQPVGLSSIGGSTVQKHWDVPEEKSAVKQVLKTGKVDVLTLSPIWLPDDAIEQFVKLGLEHNPQLRILVQEYWMPNDEYKPVYPLETKKEVDHNATDIGKLRDATLRYAKDIETYVGGINQKLGRTSVFIVPVGMAAVALREKIVKGEAPGLKTQGELFRDTWGHGLAPLQILSSYCHFAVIYRRSPAGLNLPVPNAFKALKDMSDEDKTKLNALLQEIAWDTVSHHPMAGVMKPVAAK